MRKLLIAVAVFVCGGVLYAQTSGEITGEVRDQSGAVAPNATVVTTNVDTNVARTTQTNDAGVYSFPNLIPGHYSVKVSAAGVRDGHQNRHRATGAADCSCRLFARSRTGSQTVEVQASAQAADH